MPNIDAPFGLRRVTTSPSKIIKCFVKSDYATALFVGDPVVRVAGGSNTTVVKSGTSVHEIGTLPQIEKATAGDGNAVTGVVVGFEADPDSRTQRHSPASTEAVALVEVCPEAEFEIQADGAVGAASVGLNAVLIYTHSGSTVTGLSGVELDTTSDVPAADASNQLTIVRVSTDALRNDTTSANTVVVVRINQHTEADNTLGI